MDQKILDRMRKLQAMARDGASTNEAMIAARRLHALMIKHGITEIEIDDRPERYDTEFYEVSNKQSGVWGKWIAAAVSQLYFCQAYTESTGTNGGYNVAVGGSDKFRPIALGMVKSVVTAVDQAAKTASKFERAADVNGWAFICAFRKAAALEVASRCQELIGQAKAGELVDEESGCTLPAMTSQYDQEAAAVNAMWSGIRFKRNNRRVKAGDASGSKAGTAFGKTVQLAQNIGGAAPKLIG